MASADLELQIAIYGRLVADLDVGAVVNGRVFDRVPADAAFPYIHLGEAQEITDDVTCVSAQTVYLTLHGWSRDVGYTEVKRLAAAAKDALHLAQLSLNTWRLISINHRQTRVFRDRDGLSSHAVIDFAAFVEKT
ncbi:DUF3168 domain-containing protein [Agrobacterium rubi]|uniref:DUF3168 domain-containing protein n=1 Tax=Agrobacterium rubi TaxID=28099 RepID=UPI0015746A34|nr:DUF3168 domain-containing protein [Agrobacterium rubi]NTF07184.1 DUF3168 domain-containing protein [Agrobacterium rubi]NTF19440.1 DUF3168 domain-containing protein [Agrobacterium rubi]NTF26403.1 DUF3168 domain-containing protein [Agrobacterium rubi]